MMTSKPLCLLTLAVAGLVLMPAVALAQSIPPNLDPGVILQHEINQLRSRQFTPWMHRPITKQDLDPRPAEPLIEFHDMDVQGQIMPPDTMIPVNEK